MGLSVDGQIVRDDDVMEAITRGACRVVLGGFLDGVLTAKNSVAVGVSNPISMLMLFGGEGKNSRCAMSLHHVIH